MGLNLHVRKCHTNLNEGPVLDLCRKVDILSTREEQRGLSQIKRDSNAAAAQGRRGRD